MHNVVEVAVLHAGDDLVEETPRLVRVQLSWSQGGGWGQYYLYLHHHHRDSYHHHGRQHPTIPNASPPQKLTNPTQLNTRTYPALGDDVVEELPVGHVLHHHEDVRGRVDHLVQPDDVRVRAHLEDVDLPPHLLWSVDFGTITFTKHQRAVI